MKVLTVKQPWAWLIVSGLKDVENRSWFTNYKGPLLIHASKTWDPFALTGLHELGLLQASDEVRRHFMLFAGKADARRPNEFGAIVGRVNLEGCHHFSVPRPSRWAEPGCWHWYLRDAEQFAWPLFPVKGHQGLWEHEL